MSDARLGRAADQYRRGLRAEFRLDLFHELRGGNIGEANVDHDAIQVLLADDRERFPAGSDRQSLDVAASQFLLPDEFRRDSDSATIRSFRVRRSRE